MPTIQLKKKDLDRLMGRSLTLDELGDRLSLVKGEIKGFDEAAGEIKLELNDTNRPDLWCVEGVARQIRTYFAKKPASYPFFGARSSKAAPQVRVAPELKTLRPFIGACLARGLALDEETLVQLIQTQEKLAEGFGRKRRMVSIGLYRLDPIAFPVAYKAARPDAVKFIPLGFDSPMSLAEILKKHPKGVAYAGILSQAEEYPLLVDREDRVLSFPPIINSREIGEVRVGDTDLFVEVTGTDLRMVMLTVNILAANLADRGARIDPVEIRYPYSTDFGRTIVMPSKLGGPMDLGLDRFSAALGETVGAAEASSVLKAYGYTVAARGRKLVVAVPPFRDDLMHPVDVVEDFAISRGYDSFTAEMPLDYTVGGLSPIERLSDRVRGAMIGLGFQEVISNILSNREELIGRMNLSGSGEERRLVAVENVMSQTYSAIRNAIIPSLLRVEAASSKSFYPHRVFETGEASVTDESAPEGTRTLVSLGALIAHPAANFSELHAGLDWLMYHMGWSYTLEPVGHPSYMEGRAGSILVEGRAAGLIGELHPAVLEKWQIAMPGAAFEINLSALAGEGNGPKSKNGEV